LNHFASKSSSQSKEFLTMKCCVDVYH
jgi:hypothetical protein